MHIQCQRCAVETDVKTPMSGQRVAWRCPRCHARHRLDTTMLLIQSIELEDRYVLPVNLQAPPAAISDLEEAALAFNANAPRAAVVMVRRALENVCDSLGANGSRLVDKIRDLGTRKVISEPDVAAATAMRVFGNYGAHPKDDLLDDVDDDQAEMALKLAERFLQQAGRPSNTALNATVGRGRPPAR